MEPLNQKRPQARRRVLLNYMLRGGYQISFLEEDCRTPLPLKLTFADAGKIIEMQTRWGELRTLEAIKDTERALAMGRPGSFWLSLSTEEHQKLLVPGGTSRR